MSTRLIDITDIEQGTIDNYGNQSSSTRVRSAGRYPINFFGLQIKINVESSSSIKTNIMLYTDSTTNRALWDSGWFDNGQGIDISNYPTAKYFRVVLRKSDGANIIPSDIVICEAEIVESDGIQNIDNWIKNSADFTQFDNVYSNGVNTLTFTGGGGCERIYFPVNVTQGISLTFSLKFCSPTGFTCQYGDNKDYIAITKAVPSGSGQITDFQILGRTAVSSDASSVLREYSVTVTPNYSGIAYLVIDMGYMTNNVQTELIYSDISAKIDYDWNIIDGEITNRNFISMPEKYMEKPYPAALWRIDPAVNNGYPYHELLPDIRGIDLWALERKYQIYVYDMHEPQSGFDGNGLAILDPVSCTSLHNDERWEIEMHHPIDDWGKWKNLLVSNVLKVDGQLFRIDVSEPEIGESGREMYVHAKHISQDMADMLIINETFRGGNAEAFIDFCFSRYDKVGVPGYEYYQFEGHSDIDTVCDASDYINTTVWAAMVGADNCLINRFGGELYRDNFYFSINKRMQYAKDNAFYLRYSLDMVKISQRVDYTDFCTNLVCYDNYGGMWSVWDTSGWIRTRVHHPIVRMAQFNYPEYEGAFQQLMVDGFNLWLQVSVPKITYDVQLAALKNDPRYADFLELQNYNYGDSGTIYCPELDIETEQKITEVEKDELTGDITRMILGNLRNSVTRPDYLGSTITSGRSPADKQSKAVQEQLYELAFETLILTPITTSDGKYLTTADGKYIQYRSD